MSQFKTYFVCLFFMICCGMAWADAYPLREAAECRVRDGLPNFFAKLEQGKAVNIAYLGGSITAQEGWRPKTLRWFQNAYPQADMAQIHAAIGGTGSDLGVFRLKQDVLAHHPDLLFVEFAVNDGGADPHRIHQAMEGIVRQTYRGDPRADICFVYTLVGNWTQTLREGKFPRAASAMEAIADHYGIPSIHMGLKVAHMEGEGTLIFKGAKPKTQEEHEALGDKILFSPDNVHPYTDSGHELYLQAVVRGMKQIREVGKPGPHTLPTPLVEDNWEKAKMVSLSEADLSTGWKKMNAEKHSLAKRFKKRMPEMYFTNQPGETISFRFKGTDLRIYDLLGPDCGQVKVTIDGRPSFVKPRFDKYCTYHRLGSFTIAENLADTVHSVKIELLAEQPDKAAILAQKNNTIDDPKRFDDTAWYVGAILVVGDVVSNETGQNEASKSIYAKNNLVAWCIVPFDAKQRGPEARAKMLARLGIEKMAYDWRAKHIPTFDEELDMLKKYGIELTAFWIPIDLTPQDDDNAQRIMDLLERRQVKTQIWITMHDKKLDAMDQAERVQACAKAIGSIAKRAKTFGSQVALYNHGGWFGEPENQIAIIEAMGMDNVGIIYCFHHGHEHLDRFPSLFATMKPYLLALSLNGMKKEGPKIIPLGQGNRELEMMRIVKESGWQGPVAILDHRNELDTAKSLRENLDGMQGLLKEMGDTSALDSYSIH